MGRPSDYRPEYCEQARKLCQLGATDREVADFFEVDERTVYRWKHAHPEFCQALKIGKDVADDRVEQALYRKAIGYKLDAVKIFNDQGAPMTVDYVEHVAPDTTACIFWLKNRRPGDWRDKVEREISGSLSLQKTDLTDDQLASIAAGGGSGTAGEA